MEKEYVELVMWETVRNDLKLPIEDNNDGLIYLRVFFDRTAVDILNNDWNDYLLSDYIQFQREVKLNKILN